MICYDENEVARRSRSTWACELKLSYNTSRFDGMSHAPRERVSWNYTAEQVKDFADVTLHVSVWVEIFKSSYCLFNACGHAPRERVSWNHKVIMECVTL